MTAQFSIREADPQIVARLAHDLGLPRFIATTLGGPRHHHGAGRQALFESLAGPRLAQPLEIPGLAEVADGLINAIREKKRIVVFGDFDLDGISATTVLTRGLRALGACAVPFIPASLRGGLRHHRGRLRARPRTQSPRRHRHRGLRHRLQERRRPTS